MGTRKNGSVYYAGYYFLKNALRTVGFIRRHHELKAWLALSSESQQRDGRSGTIDDRRENLRNEFFSLLPPRTIAPWSLLSHFYRVVCYRYGVYRFNFLNMACFGGSYHTQNCCPNQTDSQTKVKLVSNWYEPKINNLQRQLEKDE